MLCCASYFQLSSQCLGVPMKHCLSCLLYYLVAHKVSIYFWFCSIVQLAVFLLPPGLDACPSQGYHSFPSIYFASSCLWSWSESGTVRLHCFSQEHNTMSILLVPWFVWDNPELHDPLSSTFTIE